MNLNIYLLLELLLSNWKEQKCRLGPVILTKMSDISWGPPNQNFVLKN